MIFHFNGKYNGKPEELPNQKKISNAVPFRELSIEKMTLFINALSIILAVITFGLGYLRTGGLSYISGTGIVLAILSLFPHELLHAVCFQKDVYMYTYYERAILFVLGEEDMTKARFCIMCLLPNIAFGFIPYFAFLIDPSFVVIGTMGALAISVGAGDYVNVFNALTQVPKGALIYMHRLNTHWYNPKTSGE